MVDHNPLPPHLHDQVGVLADLVGKETSASNAVFVISQALGAAYRAGHRDGMAQARETKWITDELEKQLAAKNKTPRSNP